MIEDIKKEILNIQDNDYDSVYGYKNIIMKILDKYKNQEDKYKEILKELKNQPTKYITRYLDKLDFVEEKTLNELIKELEEKHNIGGNK